MALDAYGRPYWLDLQDRTASAESPLDLHNWLAPPSRRVDVSGLVMPQLAVDLRLASSANMVAPKNGRYEEHELGNRFALNAKLGRTHLGVVHNWYFHEDVGHDATVGGARQDLLSASTFASPYPALLTAADGIQLAQELHDVGSVRVGYAGEQPSTSNSDVGANLWIAEMIGKLPRSSRISLQVGWALEKRRLLGTVGGGALEVPPSSSTLFTRLASSLQLNDHIEVFGHASIGFTDPARSVGSLLKNVSALRSSSFAIGMARRNLFSVGDALTVAVSQPLRVDAGTATVNRPIGRDSDGNIITDAERIALAPEGRELDFELGYSLSLGGSATVGLNWLSQLEPGHNREASPTNTLAIRLRAAF